MMDVHFDPPSSIFDRSGSGHIRREPACRAQQPCVTVARADQLYPDRQCVAALEQWQ